MINCIFLDLSGKIVHKYKGKDYFQTWQGDVILCSTSAHYIISTEQRALVETIRYYTHLRLRDKIGPTLGQNYIWYWSITHHPSFSDCHGSISPDANHHVTNYTAVQSQKAVSAYFTSKQIQSFGFGRFAEQNTTLFWWLVVENRHKPD